MLSSSAMTVRISLSSSMTRSLGRFWLGKGEGRAEARRGGQGDVALHRLRELLGDGEAEAGAAILAGGRRVGLAEGLEQAGLLLGRHADAGVDDGELHVIGVLLDDAGGLE